MRNLEKIIKAKFRVLRETPCGFTKHFKWEDIEMRGCQISRVLYALISNPRGITAQDISHWGLRMSGYISTLRHDYGLEIETIDEPHEISSKRKGSHARYKLKTKVKIVDVTWDKKEWWKW